MIETPEEYLIVTKKLHGQYPDDLSFDIKTDDFDPQQFVILVCY